MAADPVIITDPNTELVVGQRYLFYFKIPRLATDNGLATALSDYVNVHTTLFEKVADQTGTAGSNHIEILGTTVNRGTSEFIADVRIKGTPVLLVIYLITQIVLILAAAYVLVNFTKAVLVPVGTGLGSAVDKIGTGLEKIGEGLNTGLGGLGSGAGTGLKFGLPVVALGISVLVLGSLFGAVIFAKKRG